MLTKEILSVLGEAHSQEDYWQAAAYLGQAAVSLSEENNTVEILPGAVTPRVEQAGYTGTRTAEGYVIQIDRMQKSPRIALYLRKLMSPIDEEITRHPILAEAMVPRDTDIRPVDLARIGGSSIYAGYKFLKSPLIYPLQDKSSQKDFVRFIREFSGWLMTAKRVDEDDIAGVPEVSSV